MPTFSQTSNNDDVQIASSVHSVASSAIGSGHILINKTIDNVKFKIYKLGSPTGNMHAKVFHSDGSSDIIESKDVSQLTSSAAWVTFTASSSITITSGSWIGLEYTNGTYSQHSVVCRWLVNQSPDSNMHVKLYTNSAWSELTQHEFTFQVDYPYSGSGGGSGGGEEEETTTSDEGTLPIEHILYLNTRVPK